MATKKQSSRLILFDFGALLSTQTPRRELTGEQNLCIALLGTLVADLRETTARGKRRLKSKVQQKRRREAIEWVEQFSDLPGGFVWACQATGYDPSMAKHGIARWIAKGCPVPRCKIKLCGNIVEKHGELCPKCTEFRKAA